VRHLPIAASITRRRRVIVAGTLATAAALVLTACGNTGSTAGSGTPSASAPSGVVQQIPTLAPDSAAGPGVSADSIKIGIPYVTSPDKLNQSAGVTNATSGPQRDYAQAVIDDINAHGGLGGKTLVPVWHAYDATSTAPADVQDQAACADFTQDNHVFAAIGSGSDTLLQCLSSAGTVMVDDNVSTYGASTFVKYPTFVELCCATLERLANEESTALTAQHFFDPWNTTTGKPGTGAAKVGVLSFDDPAFKDAVNKVLVPELQAAGHSTQTFFARTPQTAADLQNLTADIKAAVLKFKSSGVTHVIIFESSGELSYFFYTDALQQHFFPRYGVNSADATQLLIDGKKVTGAQLNGAVGYSWTPFSDIPAKANSDTGKYANDTRKRCVAVMKAKGIKFPSQNGEAIAVLYCDELYFLQYAVGHMGSTINASSWVQAVNGIGAGFVPGDTFGSYLDPTHHDAADSVYYYRYVSSCNCMQYTGEPVRVP
jgi:hypothetical protein